MTKFESLIQLIYSMTMSEKRAFRGKTSRKQAATDYLILYEIIEQGPNKTVNNLRKEFFTLRPKVAFETTVKYLLELLLDNMLELRKNQDSFFILFNKILKARILFEKALFDECFEMLRNTINQAEKFENYYALLLASRLEIEYLLTLNFPNMSERELLSKQFKLTEVLKNIRKINEQSSLFEILKHRVIYKGYARSQKQKDELNDLVFSELSIVASRAPDNFEISKLHQLFQSNYLISVGDYKSALRSYYELNNLFEANKHLWSSPPIYYIHTLEGVLESLRSIHNYQAMPYFIDQIKKIVSPSLDFKVHLCCIIYLYEIFPHLDSGEFSTAKGIMDSYIQPLYNKIDTLNQAKQAELSLYTSLIYFGDRNYQKAHKFLSPIILRGKNYYYLPIYRTIRLVNLMILYKLEDIESIHSEIRSLKRDLAKMEKGYKIERFMLKFLIWQIPTFAKKREVLWLKVEKELNEIRQDVFEQQILRIFNFTAWIESLIRHIPLTEILKQNVKR